MGLFSVILIVASLLQFSASDRQGDALYDMKLKLNATGNQLADWNQNQVNPCTWNSVICDSSNNVVQVTLASLGFTGILSPRIGELEYLNVLSLPGNNITGGIPEQFGNLSRLTSLDLENNMLVGPIPASLGKLSKLQLLILSQNYLNGSIPATLASISRLTLLSCRLSGSERSMQSNVPRATRVLVSRGEGANKPGASPSVSQSSEGKVMQPQRGLLGPSRLQNAAPDHKKVARTSGLCSSTQDDCTLATPSTLGNITDTCDRNVGQNHHLMCDADQMLSRNSLVGEAFKKEQFFSVGGPQSAVTVDSRMDSMLSYLHSVSLTARDNFPANQGSHDPNMNHQDLEIADEAVDMDIKYDAVNLHERGTEEACNQNHAEPLTRCSAIGSSTAVSLHSGPTPTAQSTQAPQVSRYASPLQIQESAVESCRSVQDHVPQKQHAGVTGVGDWNPHKQQVQNVDNGTTDKAVSGIGSSLTHDQSMSARDGGGSRPSKVEKERRKKNYDSNVFFKVNGKLYQKLGKIGSGGSSEVHKVISAECIIYALKKIKLKGRDYPTAYGFCQEIEYLNKLKGKSNIIQLIDYEVTDKSLLLEDSMSPRKDGRIKDDHYIYMVLEYGEIDLAHMVAQKWKERNSSNTKIDENWLRFYWQQMLEAVSTIHEERIVHSDLKPANFMLVRGSLKLIDFGIAKAIMNDTTNIQRDAQVGTLNYMSPEAFMCNDQDSGGNVIKCGRPSDIWSLGCILYQMVYGKTPFADYKTFWAKYKEVTNRNHKIKYEAVDNPWLIDLMQRCLAWDRDERWRIPQLLQHPFLNPPVPLDLPSTDRDPCGFQDFVRRIRVHWDNPVVARLRSDIEKLGEDQC